MYRMVERLRLVACMWLHMLNCRVYKKENKLVLKEKVCVVKQLLSENNDGTLSQIFI